ncbi:TetR/AcrR family transcriptional regulator [Algicella marina]|uniref:TetR family transcriptional regulator n=1 Tax=Algicella marina TaxID=2683284 RepID=A0A6P1T071_9RHOB|nr:TetR/AcrR family transcriptional regulator [Algicella marina]QHQ36128.1 TetR family transcriptional regulator [Algicella marina]
MARPAKFDRADAVFRAMQAIWSNGFERCSVKSLSELLGMTRSSFYNAFGSRESLFREAIAPYASQAPGAILNDPVKSPALPVIIRTVREICRSTAADPEGRGCMIQNTIIELCPDDHADGLGAELSNMVSGSIARIEELLHVAKANGEISADHDIHATALAVQNLMMGLNVLCKVIRSEEELWLLARTTLQGLGIVKPQ